MLSKEIKDRIVSVYLEYDPYGAPEEDIRQNLAMYKTKADYVALIENLLDMIEDYQNDN